MFVCYRGKEFCQRLNLETGEATRCSKNEAALDGRVISITGDETNRKVIWLPEKDKNDWVLKVSSFTYWRGKLVEGTNILFLANKKFRGDEIAIEPDKRSRWGIHWFGKVGGIHKEMCDFHLPIDDLSVLSDEWRPADLYVQLSGLSKNPGNWKEKLWAVGRYLDKHGDVLPVKIDGINSITIDVTCAAWVKRGEAVQVDEEVQRKYRRWQLL